MEDDVGTGSQIESTPMDDEDTGKKKETEVLAGVLIQDLLSYTVLRDNT